MYNIDLNKASVQDVFLALHFIHLTKRLQLKVEEKELVAHFIEVKETVLNHVPEDLKNDFDRLTPQFLDAFSKEKYDNRTIPDLVNDPTGNLFEEELYRTASVQTHAKKPTEFTLPVDKVNANVWRVHNFCAVPVPSSITITNFERSELLPIAVEGKADKDNGKKRTVYYGIDFCDEKLQVNQKLTALDQRVHDAIGTLYNAGNEYMSLSQIAAVMGNRSNPSTNMIERIEKSIYKMMTAAVILDQTEDYSKYTELVIEKKYIGNVLAAERKMATINGQLVADALHLYREPILMEFARVRGQLSRVPKEVIENTKRQTDNNIAIETYLMQRIARMKDPKAKAIKKIRYDAIFKDAELVGKQQQRAMSTIFEYLDHYKKVGWIEGYSRIKEGVQIST